ncbi:hypothetical protein FJY94_08860 [Candidatus Kaiserbacteria bacterium]|nr:hypothetical protein [Candidatus Kaiserbacteria bacterium]
MDAYLKAVISIVAYSGIADDTVPKELVEELRRLDLDRFLADDLGAWLKQNAFPNKFGSRDEDKNYVLHTITLCIESPYKGSGRIDQFVGIIAREDLKKFKTFSDFFVLGDGEIFATRKFKDFGEREIVLTCIERSSDVEGSAHRKEPQDDTIRLSIASVLCNTSSEPTTSPRLRVREASFSWKDLKWKRVP